MSILNKAIGGYFELELPPSIQGKYQDALKYQSARAAFLALLRFKSPSRVWMPHYICESMLAPLKALNIEICFYSLDANLGIADEITLGGNDLLLYVNYFGVCIQQCDALLLRFCPEQIVLDCSQAFYAPLRDCYASVYSPRKFFGIPDGGLLLTESQINPPEVLDVGSEDRMQHLIKRLGGSVEEGYQDFKIAEASLKDMEPRGMSMLTLRLLGAVDIEAVRIARNRNFSYLRDRLDKTNILNLPLDVDGPHCYPYLPARSMSRDIFIRDGIFLATYWPDVPGRTLAGSFEYKLAQECLPIPCDQRCDKGDLDRIIALMDSVN